MNAQQPDMRGAALLLVMWLIALLAALVGAFALIARTEYLQGRVLVRGLVAENAARAGIEYAHDPRRRQPIRAGNGCPTAARIAGVTATRRSK